MFLSKILQQTLMNSKKGKIATKLCNKNGLFRYFTDGKLFSGHVLYSKSKNPIRDSSVIIQNGSSINEMPFFVQVIEGEFKFSSYQDDFSEMNGEHSQGIHLEKIKVDTLYKDYTSVEEETEMIFGFLRCNSIQELHDLIKVCPSNEINPSIAYAILKKTFQLQKNSSDLINEKEKSDFFHVSLTKNLLFIICQSKDVQVIINSLKILGRKYKFEDSIHKENLENILALCTECIVRCTDGELTLIQICELIKSFNGLGHIGKPFIEKVWLGLNPKRLVLDREICYLISVLPLVKKSRPYLNQYVEFKFPSVWRTLKPEHVLRTVQVLIQLDMKTSRLLPFISYWTKLNLHSLSEGSFRWILYAFLVLRYTDEAIQSSIAKYMKMKAPHLDDFSLIGHIMDYSAATRARHVPMLDLISSTFIKNSEKFSPKDISSMIYGFGILNYNPKDTTNFFHALEQQLKSRFGEYTPPVFIDIMLSCLYLKRYPLNFIDKLFNPYYMNLLHEMTDNYDEDLCREKLAIIDAVFNFEHPLYKGPYLQESFNKRTSWKDARIKKCVKTILSPIIEIVGNSDRISRDVKPNGLPNSSFFTIDLVVDLSGKPNHTITTPKKEKLAFNVHLPIHFDSLTQYLNGPQAMKLRILEQAGYLGVSLNYDFIMKNRNDHQVLVEYVKKEIYRVSLY